LRLPGWFIAVGGLDALVAVILACSLQGCGGQEGAAVSDEATPQSGGSLVVLSESPQSLDPVLSDEVYEAVVDRQIMGPRALDAGLRHSRSDTSGRLTRRHAGRSV
jgi:hypothetical protein